MYVNLDWFSNVLRKNDQVNESFCVITVLKQEKFNLALPYMACWKGWIMNTTHRSTVEPCRVTPAELHPRRRSGLVPSGTLLDR